MTRLADLVARLAARWRAWRRARLRRRWQARTGRAGVAVLDRFLERTAHLRETTTHKTPPPDGDE